MKIGISLSVYEAEKSCIVLSKGGFEKKLSIAKEMGYDGLDLFGKLTSAGEAREVYKAVAAYDLEVPLFTAPILVAKGCNLSLRDDEKRRKSIDMYKEQIEFANIIGAARMPIGFLRGQLDEDRDYCEYCDKLAESIEILSDFGKDYGIQLALEPINRYEMNTFNDVSSSLKFMKIYNLENKIALLLDAFHMNIEDDSIPKQIQASKGIVHHFHLPDSNRYACGSGHLDYEGIFGALKNIEYEDYVSVEAFPVPDQLTCAGKSIKCLKQYV